MADPRLGETRAYATTIPTRDDTIRSLLSDISQLVNEVTDTAADMRLKVMPPEPSSDQACREVTMPCILAQLRDLRSRLRTFAGDLGEINSAI